MKEYVLGFAFDKKKERVVLIKKLRPDWQKGFLNGVGGKIELDDYNEHFAMSREFKEEAGVDSFPETWNKFATMTFDNDIMGGSAKVHCFSAFSDNIVDCYSAEEEEIFICYIEDLSKLPLIKNLKFLIPMAMDEDVLHCELKIA